MMKRSVITSALAIAAGLIFTTACSNRTANTEPVAVEVHLTALGMHCGSCEETVESTFKKMPGVDSVKADYLTGDVFVLVDTTQTHYSRLEDLISELGFDKLNDDLSM